MTSCTAAETRNRLFLFVFVFVLITFSVSAQSSIPSWPSETRNTLSRIEIYGVNEAPDRYPWAPLERPIIEIHLATVIPVYRSIVQTRTLGEIVWSFGAPISMTVIDDFLEEETAPVINVDYWLGSEVQVLKHVEGRWIENVSLLLRPLFHESSHIGDELALRQAADNPETFYRINISYEAWSFLLGVNEWQPGGGNNLTIRAGITGLWNGDGYYSNWNSSEIGALAGTVTGGERRLEYTLQLHGVVEKAPSFFGDRVFFGSGEIHWRTVPTYFSSDPGDLRPNFDIAVGCIRPSPDVPSPAFYLTWYYGQVPWGMFRNEYGHMHAGAGFSLSFY